MGVAKEKDEKVEQDGKQQGKSDNSEGSEEEPTEAREITDKKKSSIERNDGEAEPASLLPAPLNREAPLTHQEELALQLHKHETKTLYSKCLLLVGYDSKHASENTDFHNQFALMAWQREGERLKQVMGSKNDDDGSLNSKRKRESGGAATAPPPSVTQAQAMFCAGLHMHRLEEKHSHKPIVHNPKNGEAHIDFVVGDKVECYGNMTVRGAFAAAAAHVTDGTCCDGDDDDSGNCANSDCPKPPTLSAAQRQESTSATSTTSGDPGAVATAANLAANMTHAPHVLDVNNIDWGSDEWNADFSDDGLLGLFKLSDMQASAASASTPSATGSALSASGCAMSTSGSATATAYVADVSAAAGGSPTSGGKKVNQLQILHDQQQPDVGAASTQPPKKKTKHSSAV